MSYLFPVLVELVVGATRALNAQEATVIGHSVGGHLALEMTEHLPELRGVLITGTPPIGKPPRMESAFLPSPAGPLIFKADLSDEEIALWKEESFADAGASGSERFPEFFDLVKRSDPRFRAGIVESVAQQKYADEIELARKLGSRLAIVQGEEERLISTEYIRGLGLQKIWKGDVRMIQGAGHWAHWEKFEVFNEILDSFARDC